MHFYCLPCMLHTSQLIHTALITLFYVTNVQIIKLPITHFFCFSCYFPCLKTRHSHHTYQPFTLLKGKKECNSIYLGKQCCLNLQYKIEENPTICIHGCRINDAHSVECLTYSANSVHHYSQATYLVT